MSSNKNNVSDKKLITNIKKLLLLIGENPDRKGLKDTPKRVVKMYKELFAGYSVDKQPSITVFDNEGCSDEMIIDESYFYSLCEHHMLPFFGKVIVAYVPDKKIIGLSKISRVINFFSARLQVQERLTKQIAVFLQDKLRCKGVIVLVSARHLCREMRGVKKHNGFMTTMFSTGIFLADRSLRAEFLQIANSKLEKN